MNNGNGLADVVSIEEAYWRIKQKEESPSTILKPFVVGIYGFRDHGKTHFARGFANKFCNLTNPYSVLIKNGTEDLEEPLFKQVKYCFITTTPMYSRGAIHGSMLLQFGRPPNIDILIFNPNMYSQPDIGSCRQEYDLIVKNPDSYPKTLFSRR